MSKQKQEELLSAWEDLQANYGHHEGECGFDGVCFACNTNIGVCEAHSNAMAERVKRMEQAVQAIG